MSSRAWSLALKRWAASLSRPTRRPRRARLGRDSALEDRLAPANVVTHPVIQLGPDGQPVPNPAFDDAGRALPGNKSRIDDALLRLFNAYLDRGPGWAAVEPDDSRALQVDAAGRVLVRVMARDVTALGPALGAVGFATVAARPELHLTEGWLPIASLRPAEGLAAQGLSGVLPVLRPRTAVGATTSQGDWVLEADRVRAALPAGYDGTGVRIGVLSDSYNNGNGAATDVASGDLPNNVQVIQDLSSGGSDEGRAMLQLVHDVAPGAGLAFATAFTSETGFANNIRALADPAQGNAKVIVDDVYYFDEPYYQPGVIAQAVQDVYNTRGVAYFTAAGNQADQAWEGVAPTTVHTTVAGTTGNFYDFDPGPGTDVLQRVTISPGGSATIALEWDQPFYTAAGVTSDVDIFLIRADTGAVVASSTSNNLGNRTPFEFIDYGNTTGQSNFDVAIQLFTGPNVGRLKYEYYGSMSVSEYATNSPTVTAHAGVPEAVGVAAVPYFSQRSREGYTSSGPMTLLFDRAGNRLGTPVVVPGALVAAPDGTNTTFFGGDWDGDGKPNFFGTSAAAPHAAAVAALVRQAYPSLTPAQVYQKLVDSADPATDSSGFDKYTGWGLIDAYRAVFGPPVSAGTAFQETFDAGGLGPQWEAYATGPGRIQVTPANGPVSGSHVILHERLGDTGTATVSGRTELTLHVNATGANPILRFWEKEFNDDDHPMPATFTGSSDSDGVAFSVDGNAWYRLVSLTGATSANTYNSFQFDLGAAAAAAGVTLTTDTRIRFQQFDDQNFPDDGIAFDDIAFGVNQAPSFTAGPDQTALEDAGPQSVSGWATNISAGPGETGQSVSFEVVSNSSPALFGAGPAIDAAGKLTYTPAADANGAADIGVRIHDNGGTAGGGVDVSATQTFRITVTAVNDAPSFAKGADQTVLEDAGAQSVPNWATALSAGPPDESGQALSFEVTGDTNPGLFAVLPTVDAGGKLTYTPAADANGSATVTVRVRDNGGTANGGVDASPTQSFTIAVTAVNDAPSFAKGANQTVNEDAGAQSVPNWATAISPGPANESGQALTFLVSTNNDALFAVLPAVSSTGTLTYTPAADAYGSATVTVRVRDDGGTANGGQDASAPQTFTITVNSVNDAPSFTKGANQTVLEDSGPQAVSAWATGISAGPPNEAGQGLSFEITGNTNPGLFAAGPTVTAAGALAYTPAADASGTAAITIRLRDDGGTANGGVDVSATQAFTITVTAVNDAPSFTRGVDQTALEDAGAQSVANWATAISPGPNEGGQALTFLVTTNNDALFSSSPAVSAAGTLTYTPAANANGVATVTVRLRDDGGTGNGGQDTSPPQTFTIAVTAVNDAPGFTKGANQTVLEDAGPQSVSGWATGMTAGPPDESGQALTFEVVGNTNPGLFAVPPALSPAGTLTYAPAADANGTATITIRLRDDGGTANGGVDASPAQSFTITVTAVNDAPSFAKGADQAVLEDAGAQTVAGWATAISAGPNEGGQALTFLVTTNNDALFSSSPAIGLSGTLTYTAAANANGLATVTVRLRDDGGTANGGQDTSPPQTFTIAVTAVNDAPAFAKGANQTVLEDAGPVLVAGWATGISSGPADESGQALAFEVTGNTNPGLFAAQPAVTPGGTLTFTPAADASGTATIQVRLHDNGGTANGGVDVTAPQTFTISVSPVNDAPAFTKGANQTVNEDAGPQAVPGWATGISAGPPDEAGQALAFEVVSNTNPGLFGAGPAVDATGKLTYAPAADAYGSATVTVRVRDDGGTANGGVDASPTQSFTIAVSPVNDAPAFTRGANQTVLEDAGPVSVAGWATGISAGPANEAGQALTFEVVGNTNPGLFAAGPAVSPAGTLTFTPAPDANGSATIQVRVRDDGGTASGGVDLSAPQTFTIAVTPVNDPPVAVADAAATTDQQPVTKDVLANDTDADGDALTLVAVTGGTKGSAAVVNNQVRYTPRANAQGDDVLTYTVRDPSGATATGTLTVRVTDVTAPTVKEVRLYYGTGRYEVLADRIPVFGWSNIKRIQLVFSENVSVEQGNLTLTGVNVPSYAFSAFAYSAATFTATWTLAAPIGIDRVRLALDGTSSAGVRDVTAGNLVGSDLVRRFAVLPGDLDGDGVVTQLEADTVKKNIGKRYPNPRTADVNGDGVVTLADYQVVKANVGRRV